MIMTTMPIRTVSEANLREHWTVTCRRRKKHRQDAHWAMKQFARPRLPVAITLTRMSPRPLDQHDNLPISMKAAADGICDWLGVDDGSPDVQFMYRQQRSKTAGVHVMIELRHAPADGPGECETVEFEEMPCAIT